MEAIEVVEGLTEFAGRGAGADAERRAAGWLADELGAGGHDTSVETFWCRPNWALAHAWHAVFGVIGSLVSLASPVAGVAILAIALASVFVDWRSGLSLGRRLTREHASQNVVATDPATGRDADRVRLILSANYDAGRTGTAYRMWLRRPSAALRRRLNGFTPGWLGWFSLALVWLLATAAIRLSGHSSHAVAVAQVPPTAMLILAFALLLELGTSGWSPAAGDNATGVAVALALGRALQTVPPQHVEVELVLSGAGDGSQLGLRHHLRRHRAECGRANTVVLGLAACAAGRPHWWTADGTLIPLRYARPLRDLARAIAAEEPHLHLRRHPGRGATPAEPARVRRIPAIALGCLDDLGLAPGSHQPTDTIDAIDRTALDAALQFGLQMVDAIDAAVGELRRQSAATPA